MMHSNNALQMTDTRRLSPQTTSSSGYHSDLSSSTNQSPQSIHDNVEQPSSIQLEKKSNKSFSRLSSFLHKQYEKVKLKLISSKQSSSSSSTTIKTCSKATSTTPICHLPENNQRQSQSCIYKRSSFIEPIYSIYVQPLYDNQGQIPLKNSTSIHECFPHQPIHRLSSYSTTNNNHNHMNSHSYRRLVTRSNYDNISTGYISINSNKLNQNYYVKPHVSQNYYPYRYLNKHYSLNQHTYAPLSDFISSTNSAFKPIKVSRRPISHIPEQITDPCDLEVAQYFHQTSQWNNPSYFDIYTKDKLIVPSRKKYTETLC